jgi:PAS domain S-box-containing protein
MPQTVSNSPHVLISDAPQAICMVDTDMRYLAASKKWFDDYGVSAENYIGKSHYEIFPEISEDWRAIHRQCLKGDTNSRDEAKFVRANGSVQWIKWDVRPWRTDEGKIGGLLMYTEDITQRKKAEELLLETNQVARVGGWEVDLSDNSILWTSVTREIHEVSADYVPDIDSAIGFFKEGASRDTIHKLVDAALAFGTPCDEELQLITAKGREIWVEVKGKAEMIDGKCVRLIGTYQDITERKKAQVVNQALLDRLSLATKASGIGIWDYYVGTKEMVWDGQMYRLYGYKKKAGLDLYNIWLNSAHEDDREMRYTAIQKALTGEKEYNIEFRIVRPNGEVRYLKALAIVQRDSAGNAIRMTGTNWDITESKIFEEKIKESEESFRGAFEYSAVGMAIVGLKGNWVRVNESLCKIIGYSEEELLKLTFQELSHPDDLNSDLKLLQELYQKKIESYQMEKRYFHKDGRTIWVQLSVSLVTDTKGRPLYFISQINDITERRIAEHTLNATVAQLQGLLDATSQVSIIGTDLDGLITVVNKGTENLLGYKPDELVGKVTPAVLHKEDEIEKRGIELSKEYKKEITGFDVFVANAKAGKFDSREWTYIRKDGSFFPVQLVITGIKDQEGNIIGFLGIALDISKIKEVEKEMQSLIAVTSEQNDRLLNFAHIVSHNLRSHSGNISMLLQFLENEIDSKEREELFDHLKTASQQLTETISHLNEVVALTTNIEEKSEKINLLASVSNAVNNVNALVREHQVNITNTVAKKLHISGVPAYVQSIILNFITNAIKYRSPDRPPVIHISAEKEGGFVVLSIADNGIGIDMEQHGHKLFGMYKTFHGNKDARGIGLFITKNQIEAMGGKVDVSSTPNVGTTFKIYFHENN